MDCSSRSLGEPELGGPPPIAKPGRGRNSGGSQKTFRGGHDTQIQPLFRASRAKLPKSSEDGSEYKPVCQLGGGEPWRGYPRQVSRGRARRMVLPRQKETHAQVRLAQVGYATPPPPRTPQQEPTSEGKRAQFHFDVHPSYFSSLGIDTPSNGEPFKARI